MSEKDAKNRLLEGIGEVDDVYYQEAEYTEEELERLNAVVERKTAANVVVATEMPEQETDRLEEQLREIPKIEKEGAEIRPEATPKHKAATIIRITAGVALAAAAILLFVFLWNPDRSDVITTTEAESTREETTEAESMREETTEEASEEATEATEKSKFDAFAKARPGDCITLGSYEQDNNTENGEEDIEWLVMDKDGDSLLVISRYCLTYQPYNTELKDVTWNSSSLRSWLNASFYDTAFDTEEKNIIADSAVTDGISFDTRYAEKYITWCPEITATDKVFLLSDTELHWLWEKDDARVSKGTPYCLAGGTAQAESGACRWWTRGYNDYDHDNVWAVELDGSIPGGVDVDASQIAVRPAMWVRFETAKRPVEIKPEPKTEPGSQSVAVAGIDAEIGDYITFGSYEQDKDLENGSEDIEWLVLDKEDDRMLVISRYCLTTQPYNTKHTYVVWETCSLREWLNDFFYYAAFSPEEKGAILATTVSGGENPAYDTPVGNATTDKVFLLSYDEANRYFKDDAARQAWGTDYCLTNIGYSTKGFCWWWLRGPGADPGSAVDVFTNGSTNSVGAYVSGDNGAVRPAMWIKIK